MPSQHLQTVLKALEPRLKNRHSKQPFLLAIDGRSGVGKSTLARQLAQHFEALLIEGDDFYAGGVTLRSDSPQARAQSCINWQNLRKVLVELLEKGQARYQAFDWERFDGSYKQATILYARPLIIVEGVYSARPELRDLIDYCLCLHLDEKERMRRLMAREGQLSAWEHQWYPAEDWYFQHQAPPESFDLFLSTEH